MATPRRSRRPDNPPLARSFVARRLQLGLTQSELALLAGVGRSTVQAVEGGKDSAQIDGVQAIADALGCDLVLMTRAGTVVDGRNP
ncbi:helix-turn-helix domain-containing protein [Rhodococcus kroppenstedtii]|uniref:DNA-binding transcriptional regulator, XRE-family HTH domain n=1 Tax=Rhodococcoides kroppenstedtii TaxID=293050 RepID=A0A1I0TWY7_9NOCA|nr:MULTISPECIES: helix-turn-helix domain-containing protein [Rhodococcus]MBY6350838.1 helix-turn-helix transcriptional regulator [Rhodococcus corynebacterioides]MDV7195958.1 helix-turn-helix domain-containing protein [Rhodococcus kroppenstedtii]SFA56278.1 DNA-binding transcriptional regulator, XRE-family HTH domain [Rhodococcus kroppenstedtii]